LNLLILNRSIRTIIVGLGLILFQSCAPVSVRPPIPPFDQQQIAHVISSLREQETQVLTFFSSGRLRLETNDSDSEANVLIVGTRDPLRMKVEITHPWGRPLLHALIREGTVNILSFPEKRYYFGHLGGTDGPAFFPVSLEPDQLWGLVRGYSVVEDHDRAVSLKGNQIILLSKSAEQVQVIDLYPQSILPRLILFPTKDMRVLFEDFENDNGIFYAKRVRFNRPGTNTTLTLNTKQMTFNKAIPESIFELDIPPDFEVLSLPNSRDR
jgi:hypothetical protein